MARTAESMDNVAVRLLTGMITALLAVAPMLTGCSRSFEGIAAMGPRGVDPAYFFAGDVRAASGARDRAGGGIVAAAGA